AGEKAQIELESDQARYKRLLEYRDAVRAFYEDVRSIQTKVDEALNNPFDTQAFNRALEEVTRGYSKQYLKYQQIVASSATSPEERAAANKTLRNIELLEELERRRLTTKRDIARIELEEFNLTSKQQTLDERRNYGLITEQEYLEQNNNLRLDFIAQYRKEIETLEVQRQQAELIGDLTTEKTLREQIVETQLKLNKAQVVTESTLIDISKTLR